MKFYLTIIYLIIYFPTIGKEINNNHSKILILDSITEDQTYIRIQFISDIDPSIVIIDSINIINQSLSLSPSKESIAIITYNKTNNYSTKIDFYNKYRKLIKTCFIDSLNLLGRIKISNDLRFIDIGSNMKVSNITPTTVIRFYDSDCNLNQNTPLTKFGLQPQTLFTNSNFFYHLTNLDTTYCTDNCDIILFIYDSKFKLISKNIITKTNFSQIYNLKEEGNNLISLIEYKNGTELKYLINKKGKIIKIIYEK